METRTADFKTGIRHALSMFLLLSSLLVLRQCHAIAGTTWLSFELGFGGGRVLDKVAADVELGALVGHE